MAMHACRSELKGFMTTHFLFSHENVNATGMLQVIIWSEMREL
jgi:hypothetical protein